MDKLVREAITHILTERQDILKLAMRQKAKFEGWLKFELASYLETYGMQSVEVESLIGYTKFRSDISFFHDWNPYSIELKTVNTNWKIEGVRDTGRPLTKNISSVIKDTMKLNSEFGIIAFVLFPIPCEDRRWEAYISRIMKETKISLSKNKNCTIVHGDYGEFKADLVICTYKSRRFRR